jgi:hypothetical protein
MVWDSPHNHPQKVRGNSGKHYNIMIMVALDSNIFILLILDLSCSFFDIFRLFQGGGWVRRVGGGVMEY